MKKQLLLLKVIKSVRKNLLTLLRVWMKAIILWDQFLTTNLAQAGINLYGFSRNIWMGSECT